jgi:DNA-binding NarL/FixJ family response regulator
MGAAAFAVEADCELAAVLARRGGDGDAERSRQLAQHAAAAASKLGMQPWLQRARALAQGPSRQPAASTLTARELEVAGLVAAGKSNREVASALFLSERTAQNHVQHILTKLGFSNRTQITSWVLARQPDEYRIE